MAVVGVLLNGVVKKTSASIKKKHVIGHEIQEKTLKKLLSKARNTQFGQAYDFDEILLLSDPVARFQQKVPILDRKSVV